MIALQKQLVFLLHRWERFRPFLVFEEEGKLKQECCSQFLHAVKQQPSLVCPQKKRRKQKHSAMFSISKSDNRRVEKIQSNKNSFFLQFSLIFCAANFHPFHFTGNLLNLILVQINFFPQCFVSKETMSIKDICSIEMSEYFLFDTRIRQYLRRNCCLEKVFVLLQNKVGKKRIATLSIPEKQLFVHW